MAETITEVKRRLDGSELRFECELLSRSASVVMAVYRFEDRRGPIDSYGVFWARRPYLCYYMVPRDARFPAVARFDVIRDMRLATQEVSYTDLVLDLWVENGVPRWEDEDEVEALARAGRLDPGDASRISVARAVLARRYAGIVREVQALVSTGTQRQR